jgi:hypothetical protein
MKQLSSPRTHSLAAYPCLLFCCVATQLAAHSDPGGDVYPNVKVERGNFVIDFENNRAQSTRDPRDLSESSLLLRMIYSPDGILLSPRHRHRGTRGLNDTIGSAAKTEAIVGAEKITFERSRADTPGYAIEKEGKTEQHRLAWPDGYKCVFEAFAADADSICVAVVADNKLFLHHFDRHQFTPPKMVQITEPDTLSFIWDFPVVSNLVFAGGRYCIAWPRYKKGTGYECVISTWKPGEERPKEIILNGPADWNSHLSLAAMGDRLCLAYHTVSGEYQAVSKIVTAFRTITPD